MKIVREQREENNSLLKVTVGEEDYGQAVEKELREYRRKANIPGFRPGHGAHGSRQEDVRQGRAG